MVDFSNLIMTDSLGGCLYIYDMFSGLSPPPVGRSLGMGSYARLRGAGGVTQLAKLKTTCEIVSVNEAMVDTVISKHWHNVRHVDRCRYTHCDQWTYDTASRTLYIVDKTYRDHPQVIRVFSDGDDVSLTFGGYRKTLCLVSLYGGDLLVTSSLCDPQREFFREKAPYLRIVEYNETPIGRYATSAIPMYDDNRLLIGEIRQQAKRKVKREKIPVYIWDLHSNTRESVVTPDQCYEIHHLHALTENIYGYVYSCDKQRDFPFTSAILDRRVEGIATCVQFSDQLIRISDAYTVT